MKRRLMKVFLTMLCMVLPCLALAEHEMHASVGYDDTIFSGRWYPLFVEITANDEPVEGMIETRIRTGVDAYDALRLPVSVGVGETKRFRLSVRPQASQRVFEVTLTTPAGDTYSVSTSAQNSTEEDALLIGVLGGDEALVKALRALEKRDVHGELERIAAVALSSDSFAASEREMNAFDVMLVIDGSDASLDDAQSTLLAAWQSGGGILVRQESATIGDATAKQVLAQIESVQESGKTVTRENSNYRYGESLNTMMLAEHEKGLLFPAVLLIAYTAIAGVGAYALLKRLDRSKDLWLVIPALAVGACALLAVLGTVSGMNQPLSSSVHVTHYAQDGRMRSKELALLTYAGQQRMTVAAQSGVPLERMEYGYFRQYSDDEESVSLRDLITLGDAASIELIGGADWLRRALVVGNPSAPKGSIQASACMEADGLYVAVFNDTDTAIQNAVLLTEVGYAMLGDLVPGESAQVLLARSDAESLDENGNPIIRAQQMLPFSTTLYQAALAAVDPEKVDDEDFKRSELSTQEQQRRRLLQRTLELGAHNTEQDFSCVLVGETPQIACENLVVNGKPVSRSAQMSVLIREIPLEMRAESGHVFYPQGTFKRCKASINAQGIPVIGEAYDSSYVYEEDEVLLGFALRGAEPESICEIRLYASAAMIEEPETKLDVFDWEEKTWTAIEHGQLIILDEALVRRAVNASGELYLRYSGEGVAENGVYLHNIIVEGELGSRAQEGGEAYDSL